MAEILYYIFIYPFYLTGHLLAALFFNHSLNYWLLVLIPYCAYILILILPFLLAISKLPPPQRNMPLSPSEKVCFFGCCLGIFLLSGIMVPSNLFISDPRHFVSSLLFVIFVQSIGVFLFLPFAIFYLLNNICRRMMVMFAAAALFIAVLNVSSINHYGQISPFFNFMDNLRNFLPSWFLYVNFIFCFIIVSTVAFLFYKKQTKTILHILAIILISIIIMLTVNFCQIIQIQSHNIPAPAFKDLSPQIHLSKNGKNVFIFMMDRAINSFLPMIFEENPSLKEEYTGFTYYPNTLSFYGHTLLGLPPILGGYEYSPVQLHNRPEKNADKYNEAVLMLPTLFKQQGFQTTVIDVPWTDFLDISNGQVFNSHGIGYLKFKGRYNQLFQQQYPKVSSIIDKNKQRQKYNALLYTFVIAAPAVFKEFIYDNAKYLSKDPYNPVPPELIDNYSVMYFLPQITDFTAQTNTFTFMDNMLPHAESLLEMPGYTFTGNLVLQEDIQTKNQTQYSYHTNMASLQLIATFIKYLKTNGVYDNTRIIIVADHGYDATVNSNYDDFFNRNVMSFNPLLFVKDFNAYGPYKTDYTFMTNADVPLLALKDITQNPVNPFTHKQLSADYKKDGIIIYTNHKRWNPKHFPGNKILDKNPQLMKVKDNIFDQNNFVLDYKL